MVSLWQSGNQDAARLLLTRYEVRLIALVASRLNRKFLNSITPEDVVQSAMGSFFRVSITGGKSTFKLESSASAWNILATFVRRKLSRALERETAAKRGGGQNRLALDQLDADFFSLPSGMDADEVLSDLHAVLNLEQTRLVELMLEKATQLEIAEHLGVDERTIRRRIAAIRGTMERHLASNEERSRPRTESGAPNINLPNISYRQFVLGKLVGRGALGKVYRARLQTDGQVVAVKFMHRHLWTNATSRLSFLREVSHAAKIDHPGIVKTLGWGQSPHGGPFIVCEYIDGQSLSSVPGSDASTAVQWLIQVCRAVAAAHRAGVVHGDLTPNNILLANNGRIVVTDFGFATSANTPFDDSATDVRGETPGGTLGFAAPEQISPAFGVIGCATDIYAIGGLAYFLLTGHSPHQPSSWLDTVTEDDVTLPCTADTIADSKLVAVANLALKKAVDQRPQSVDELTRLLTEPTE